MVRIYADIIQRRFQRLGHFQTFEGWFSSNEYPVWTRLPITMLQKLKVVGTGTRISIAFHRLPFYCVTPGVRGLGVGPHMSLNTNIIHNPLWTKDLFYNDTLFKHLVLIMTHLCFPQPMSFDSNCQTLSHTHTDWIHLLTEPSGYSPDWSLLL